MAIKSTSAGAIAAAIAMASVLSACASDTADAIPDAVQLETNNIDCSSEGLGSDHEIQFEVAYRVVDGELGEACFGKGSPTLVDAWSLLDTIAPGDALDTLGVFAGFTSREKGDEISVAFVSSANEEGSLFQMSLNLEASVEDGDYLAVTLAHELSHVFTALPDQLARSKFGVGSKTCATYFNGEGCYAADALITTWIDAFWTEDMIDDINPILEASADDGQARCDLNAGFLGAYAASSPEEDFAESFGAYVLQVQAGSPGQQQRFDWFEARPELARFRTAAEAAGIGPLANTFDRCG